MQVVRRTNADKINLFAFPAEFVNMSVKSLEFYEEIGIRKIGINDPDTVVYIKGCNQVVMRLMYGLQMPYGNVTGHTYQSEILFHTLLTSPFFNS